MKSLRPIALTMATALITACAHTPPGEPSDPLEPVNRVVLGFNLTADKYVLRPIARGYDKVAPDPVRKGVANFFRNLQEPRTVVNGLLQGKVKQAASDTGRFLLNSTAGFAGLMDVATNAGLLRHDEDFGQTIGYYGVGSGWYLMLPFLGPSSNRDLLGRGGDYFTGYSYYVQEPEVSYPLLAVDTIDSRARLLPADALLEEALDKYVLVRTAYLQQRLNKVYDGAPPAKLLYGTEDEE
ncbi:MAG: VacJ family lipoprotein [Pseudomonadota bacterium]